MCIASTRPTSPPFAFIKGEADSSTLLLGDEKSILAAIDRRGGALVPASALLRRAQALAATHDFWLIADGPLTGFQPTAAGASNPLAAQMAAQVKGLDMGLALRDGFQLEVSVAAESDAVAAQMTQLLSTQIQMALQRNQSAGSGGDRPQAAHCRGGESHATQSWRSRKMNLCSKCKPHRRRARRRPRRLPRSPLCRRCVSQAGQSGTDHDLWSGRRSARNPINALKIVNGESRRT